MTGALLQLVAYGVDDVYLTQDPQITYFKVVYRRHTNFTKEQIPQPFINTPDFGKRATCVISKNADLVGKIYIVVRLPKVRTLNDEKTKFAWVKRIGFSLIKSVEVEINGRIIDKQYGEWLNLWAELTGEINEGRGRGLKTLIGDIPEITDFTNSKDEYTLYIPLQFWFCKSTGNALPLVSLQYCDVKINVEFEESQNCYFLSPTHYIKCRDDIVNFLPYEYIEQNIDGKIISGIFISYDINSKRLYYYKITDDKLLSIPVSSSFITANSQIDIDNLLSSPQGLKYSIVGKTSGYSTFAEFGNSTSTYSTTKLKNLNISQCFLLVDYYFLDDEERLKFSQAKHDYLIEQIFFTPSIDIDNSSFSGSVIVDNPCKLIVWVAQMQYIQKAKDYFNYTHSYQNKIFEEEDPEVKMGEPMGDPLILKQTILMNGNSRVSLRDASYFDNIQKIMHCRCTGLPGINMYAFGMYPFIIQPSGSCNMSQIDNIQIQLNLTSNVNVLNHANFRAYCLCNNVLRIAGGLAATVFLK